MKEFTAEYLEKVLEPWLAVWRTNVFEVLVEVKGMWLFRHLSPTNVIYLSNRQITFYEIYELLENSMFFVCNCQ